ncbi:MAG: hypothetical protein CMA83_01375 [Euryarchaeota archaeon]|nr:hypothetical protein [Euryarchaeota archaeon]
MRWLKASRLPVTAKEQGRFFALFTNQEKRSLTIMAVANQSTLKIDTEFQHLLRQLSSEEYESLEKNIIDAGKATDPIIAWNGVIIDGHHRHRICGEHNLPYRIEEVDFATRAQARAWIINHQYGRRNMTPQEVSYMRAQILMSRVSSKDRNKTEETRNLAKSSGVTARTIRNDIEFAKDVDSLHEDVKKDILSGAVKANRKQVKSLSSKEPKAQKNITKKVKNGSAKNISVAMPEDDTLSSMAIPYRRAVLDIQRIMRDMDAICLDPSKGAYIATKQTRYQALLQEAEDIFKQCEPCEECDKCGGAGCNNCYSTGFLSRTGVESRDK